MAPFAKNNLEKLFNAWHRASTGQLVLRAMNAPMSDPVVVPLAGGGLLHRGAWDTLLERMDTHVISLDEQPVGGHGNRRLMIALIQAACRRYRVEESQLVDAARTGAAGPTGGSQLLPSLVLLPTILPDAGPDGSDATQDRLFQRGRDLLAQGWYNQADLVLSTARDLRLDHAPTLACLARARLRNPERDPEERHRDAVAMVRLACQLAPDDPEVVQAQDVVLRKAPLAPQRRRAEL